MLLFYICIDTNHSENKSVNILIKVFGGFFSVVFSTHEKIRAKHKAYEPQFVLQ